jgi:hypothetical protein
MSLRRIAGVAVAAAIVASGAGLLLSGPSGAVTPPTPITLGATGMASSSCPLPLYGSIALKPGTTVQFKPGVALSLGQSMTLSVLSEAKTTPAPVAKNYAVPAAGVAVAFPSTGSYALNWKTSGVLGMSQKGKLVLNANAAGCKVAVQLPVPSVSASVVPSPILSGINGAIGGVVSSANGALGPINSALPTLPTAPTLPGVNPPVLSPPVINPPGASTPAGNQGPGTTYKPTGPTVADRTVPDGYGNGSGLGGLYVPGSGGSATGGSITAPGQQQGAGNAAQPTGVAGSAERQANPAGSPRTVELATNRPRSALGALPTLAVVLAILALSGATAFYARTFLLQPTQR